MNAQLSGHHQKTYERILQHPMPHTLKWLEVWSMLDAIPDAKAIEETNGNLKVTRNGQTLSIHRPRSKDLADKEELMKVRHFLERSGTPITAPTSVGKHLLVVIDHREARIYETEMHGSVPHRITPYDPFGFGRDLRYNQDDSNGQRKPEQKSFYEAVAKTLEGAQQILIFGTGTGASSAMDQLILDLKHHHHTLIDRLIGTIAVDEHHLTEDQLLAKARDYFALS